MMTFVLLWLAGAALCALWLMIRAMQPAPGEAPEDGGAYWDAGALQVCWRCGTSINGPADGLRIPDRECWGCYCIRYNPDDDCPVIPNYVANPARD